MWATVVMAIAAFAVAVVFVFRQPVGSRTIDRTAGPVVLSAVDAPETLLKYASPAVRKPGAVILVEIMDVECPFCATFAPRLDSLRAILGDTVQLLFSHYPIRGHRFARSGAVAIECAFQQAHGYEFVRAIYENQDSIGLWPWATFARLVQMPDSASFGLCLEDRAVGARVDSAKRAGEAARIPGTPTVWVNGAQYSSPPELDRMLADVRRLAANPRP
jgi:protein-disulfide isomerase